MKQSFNPRKKEDDTDAPTAIHEEPAAIWIKNVVPSGNMKSHLWIVLLLLTVALATVFWILQTHRIHEQDCLNNLRMLQSAAVSYCLEHKLGPDAMLNVGTLSPYLKPGTIACPDGRAPYPPFSVLQGPSCPNGHSFAPEATFPLKATDPKTAGLQRNFGSTNSIEAAPGHAR